MPPLPLTGSALPTFLNITTKQKFKGILPHPRRTEASHFSARANYDDYAIGTPDGNRDGRLGIKLRSPAPSHCSLSAAISLSCSTSDSTNIAPTDKDRYLIDIDEEHQNSIRNLTTSDLGDRASDPEVTIDRTTLDDPPVPLTQMSYPP